MSGAQFALVESYSEAKQSEEADTFKQRLFSIASHGMLSMALSLGVELGLFKALAKASGNSADHPATAAGVAQMAGMKERYVQEWLACMACAEIIEMDESGQHFWIPEERLAALVGGHNSPPDGSLLSNMMIPCFGGSAFKRVEEVFKKDGPPGLDYSVYDDFYHRMNQCSQGLHKKQLCTEFIDAIEMREALEKGIEVLDVGCGEGMHIMELATHFPKSQFTGVDLSASALKMGATSAEKHHLANVTFIHCDAAAMPEEWTNRFGLVLIFDACHDQCRPDLALAEVHRCLRPATGLFAMVEINGTGNCHADKVKFGPDRPTYYYAVSLFHCLPVGSNEPDALQLGTMWGVERGRALLEQAGFKREAVAVVELPFYSDNVLYKAMKGVEEA